MRFGIGLLALAASALLTAQSNPHDVTIITERGRETIPVSELSGVAMVPLTALVELVGAEQRPASEQGVSISADGTIARVSDGRYFVSVAGKLVALKSPARLVSGQWFVPLDFISKVLPSLSRESLTYRDRERTLIVGDAFPKLQVRTSRDPSYTRVEVSTSRKIDLELTEAAREIRLSIHTPYLETDFRNEEILDDVVERIRLERKESLYEIVVELGDRFGTLKKIDRAAPEYGVVLDLLRSRVPTPGRGGTPGEIETIARDLGPAEGRGEGSTPTWPPSPEVATIELPPEDTDRLPREPSGITELRVVVLDPGHGGAEIGAEGKGGLAEKDLVLAVARQLRSYLQDRLGLRVILTRDGDRNLALDERTAVANNNKADLFISIHADASPSRDARGSSVYFLSYSEGEQVASAAAARAEAASGGTNGLDFILWDMAQASHLSQSSRLAEIVQEELLSATGSEKANRGIKQNTFRVLKGATMPAVLVEIGFISNPAEEELLETTSYREGVAEALYRGVVRFKDIYEYEPVVGRTSQGRN
jgi:N-acetylmuramoyl-L-alanine amidase